MLLAISGKEYKKAFRR